MIEKGYKGFAGLIDLPGTIGGAIYGNASVGNYSISKMLVSIELLNEFGHIETLKYEDLAFCSRSSILKRHEKKGVILSCNLRLEKGEIEEERKIADIIHNWRLQNQPGPLNNLGTTALLSTRSIYGLFTFSIAKLLDLCHSSHKKDYLALKIMGVKHLSPYLFGYNRFIWKDIKAHDYFSDYLSFINKAYKNPKLEIEVL